jgi:hypothetical protein
VYTKDNTKALFLSCSHISNKHSFAIALPQPALSRLTPRVHQLRHDDSV